METADEKKRTKIKICGLTRECDVDYINEAMPDYIGFVFAESRRQISRERAEVLRKRMKAGILTAGVFVDAPAEELKQFDEIIDVVQLHGMETPEYVECIKKEIDRPVIKAINSALMYDKIKMAGSRKELSFLKEYEEAGVDYFLFDSGIASNNSYGGTGTVFDWTLLPKTKKPFFLAGGLNALNIRKAIAKTHPFGVDISSGVETDGVKDREKILDIIRRIRNDERQIRCARRTIYTGNADE